MVVFNAKNCWELKNVSNIGMLKKIKIKAKLEQISGIKERRYVKDDVDTADLAAYAGLEALKDAGMDGNDLDCIIVAHNVGNVVEGGARHLAAPAAQRHGDE